MARRADWDIDDDFEILTETSSIKKQQQDKFEFIEDDIFEIVPCKINQPSPVINTTNPIQHVTIIEQPVPVPITTDKPITDEVKPSSVERSSYLLITTDKPITDEVKPSSVERSSYLPIRYGSAAAIPHDQSFDLKSILNRKPSLPVQTNDLIHILQNNKPKKSIVPNNNLQQILLDNDSNRHNLVQIAKQAQQDFIDAIYLD